MKWELRQITLILRCPIGEPSGVSRLDGPDIDRATIKRRLGKVNTFHFLRALLYVGLILAGVTTGDHDKCG